MKSLLLLITLTVSLPIAMRAQNETLTEVQQTADEMLSNAITEGKFAGITAGFSIKGETQWLGHAGTCDEDRSTPCENITINRTASIAKTMTAVAALQLVEAGKLDLNTPIERYLPYYPQPAASKITPLMLLQQTSGIASYADSKETETQEQYNTLQEACAIFQDRELLFEPGTKYQYSTYGYVVLGAVVEAAAGQAFETYLQEHIWDVANMPNTGIEQFNETYPNKSALFHRRKSGKIKLSERNNLSNRIPAGGMYSTTEDLLRFGQAIIDGTLLSDESLQLMQTPADVDRGENNPYGMGVFLYQQSPLVMGHSAEQTGVSGQLMIMPEKEIVVVVLSNTALAWHDAIGLSVELFPLAGKLLD